MILDHKENQDRRGRKVHRVRRGLKVMWARREQLAHRVKKAIRSPMRILRKNSWLP